MKKLGILFFLLWNLSARAQAAEIPGRDFGGADLIPAEGDVLVGTFTNVGLFEVGVGTTVSVKSGMPLVLYASTISISGKLNGDARAQNRGNGGPPGSAGAAGSGAGSGGGAATSQGGGGGGHGDADGDSVSGGVGGLGGGGGTGGASHGSTGTVSSPLSPDDIRPGGGGGGGGGGGDAGGDGGDGGASIYLEASFLTISGTVTVNGGTGGAGTNLANCINNPGGGGGGAGGGILLRSPRSLNLSGGFLRATGGSGGDAVCNGAVPPHPGGGGGGGRIKIFSRQSSLSAVLLSTSAGRGGESFSSGSNGFAADGSSGTVSFGTVASSPTAFSLQAVYVTSAAWNWNSSVNWGDAPSDSRQFRLYESTAATPLEGFFKISTPSFSTSVTEESLAPNTTQARFLTAQTQWGDSLPSLTVSTHTLANRPGTASPAFSAVQTAQLTAQWSAGTPANPSYTLYEIHRSSRSNFIPADSSFIVGTSSIPLSLSPNTTYQFRVRAINLNNIPTEFGPTFSTSTLAAIPQNPTFSGLFISSLTLSWQNGGNPDPTLYTAQLSTDSFNTLVDSSQTVSLSATFFNLDPGTQYQTRVRAQNHGAIPTDFTLILSTTPGSNDPNPPSRPGRPQPDRLFSYDGSATFSWSASQSPSGVLDYFLEVGTAPGTSDFFSGNVGLTLSQTLSGLQSAKTYYARVRSRNNAGTFSEFSEASPGVAVWILQEVPAFSKPYNWPNPFDPQAQPTQIGFFLREPARVTLKIFTLQGDLVHERSEQVSAAGNQVWPWSGRNDLGSIVAPGGYIALILKHYPGGAEKQKFKIAILY
ncbi:MAG: fibronectin type III domain-containing protein [Elusimicrobia bacterium]|nr:fibronectin type III domain-containing protein [Elusimicrobiota bacterium]